MTPTSLHVVFVKPRLMLDVAKIVVRIDHAPALEAPFTAGVDATLPVAAGRHSVDVVIDTGLFTRRRRYAIDVSGPTRMELRYSRLWGNFKRRALLTPES